MNSNIVTQAMYTLLAKHSVPAACQFVQECPLPVSMPLTDSINTVNQHWRDNLGRKPNNTMEARSYLVDNCDFSEWISLMERGVVPEVVT